MAQNVKIREGYIIAARQFLVSLSYECSIPNLVKIGPVDVNERRTTRQDGRQPIVIGHLTDSGDLKTEQLLPSIR